MEFPWLGGHRLLGRMNAEVVSSRPLGRITAVAGQNSQVIHRVRETLGLRSQRCPLQTQQELFG